MADVTPAIVADVTPADVIPAIVPTIDDRIATTFPGVVVPAIVGHMARAFAVVAPMPVGTLDERRAVRDTIVASFDAAMPNTPNTGVRNTGRFSGYHVFESQNTMYLAAALCGAYVTDGHFTAMWAADLPNARCPYMERVSYPTSTLTEYVHGRHNAVPGVAGARDVVMAWVANKRNRA